MFVCRAEESLNFDEFETENDENGDVEVSIAHLDIQNVASNVIGEHECMFAHLPHNIRNESVKMVVTTEANAFNQVSTNTEFKAELIIHHTPAGIVHVSEKLNIHCPKSGNLFNFSVYLWESIMFLPCKL